MNDSRCESLLGFLFTPGFELSHEKGHTQDHEKRQFLHFAPSEIPASAFIATVHCHSLRAAVPTTLSHFALIWSSQRWSLVHLFLRSLQTPAVLQRLAGDSLINMFSSASSGRSRRVKPCISSTFSTFWEHLRFKHIAVHSLIKLLFLMNCTSDFEIPTTDQTERMLISLLTRKKVHKANGTTVAGNLKDVSRQHHSSRNPTHNEICIEH